MSTELFINRSLLPFLVWLTFSAFLLGIILTALDRLKKERMPHEQLQVRLSCSIDEFDAEIARLRGILDAYMPYDAVEDAELVLEQYQEQLKTKGE